MSAPAAPRRPRLLQRPVSPAQREAAHRNGARSCGPRTAAGKAHSSRNARLHLFTAEEEQALRAEIRDFFESMNPRSPLAVALVAQLAFASFQSRRAFGLDRNPRDTATLACQVRALGAFESRYSRLFYNTLAGLEHLDKRATERMARKKILGKRTPELIEKKENVPARRANPAPADSSPDRPRLWRLASRFPANGYARTSVVSFEEEHTHYFNVAHLSKPRKIGRFC